jgi:hypothetical protein
MCFDIFLYTFVVITPDLVKQTANSIHVVEKDRKCLINVIVTTFLFYYIEHN